MYKDKKLAVIIPAAGLGRRMGLEMKKQYLTLAGHTILSWSVKAFMIPLVDAIWVVVPKEDIVEIQKMLAEWSEELLYQGMIHVVGGSTDRQGSVYNALVDIPKTYDYVCVHDGVRPFVKRLNFKEHLSLLEVSEGFTFGVPVIDSLKKVDEGHVIESLDRSKIWAVQTPQVFNRASLLKAHEQAQSDGYVGTDDASLLERMKADIKMVMGDYMNIKVTRPEDLLIGNLIANQIMEEYK